MQDTEPNVAGVSTLTLGGAQLVLAASLHAAAELGAAVCVAVADRSGHLLAFGRMDGAALLSVSIAQDKAYTVAAFNGLATHDWFDLIKDDPALFHGIVKSERLIVFAGGVPVRARGELVGAVGVSGGSAEQDRTVAEAGARVLDQHEQGCGPDSGTLV